jgi:hypothetical protein
MNKLQPEEMGITISQTTIFTYDIYCSRSKTILITYTSSKHASDQKKPNMTGKNFHLCQNETDLLVRLGMLARSGLRSADTLTLVAPRTHLSFGDRAFSVAGPRAWNSLPLHVRSAQYTFRKLLKTYLFQRVYL